MVIQASDSVSSRKRFRTSLAIAAGLVAIFGCFALFFVVGDDRSLPDSCPEALAATRASSDRLDQEARALIDEFLASYPPGEESVARRLVEIYDEHEIILRQTVGVCPGRTVTEVKDLLETIVQARSDMLRACTASHWEC